MHDAKTNQQIARDFAAMRARDVERVETLPAAPAGKWYCKRRSVRGEDEWQLEPTLVVCGSVAVVNHGAFAMIDRSGVRIDQFYERADAERVARAIGESIEAMFARAADGNAHAMRAIFRLCAVHKCAAARRGPTGKPWTKREIKACEDARNSASFYGVKIRDGVSPHEIKKALTLYGLSKAGSFPDNKLRHWHMRLLARVEREGLPQT